MTTTTTLPRSAGTFLLIYAIGTAIAFMASGAPGGNYDAGKVAAYVASSHRTVAFTLWYVSALAALALAGFAAGVRELPGVGQACGYLAAAGAALSLTGAFVSGGVAVGVAEGGTAVLDGVPQPVIYLVTEIGNVLAVCAPAMCVGVIALVMALRTAVPGWLRVLSVIGGICGILAPFFFTYFVYLLWALVFGITVAMRGGSDRVSAAAASPV